MKHNEGFKDWKRREGLTAHIGFDRTDAYQKLQSDVRDVLKTRCAICVGVIIHRKKK